MDTLADAYNYLLTKSSAEFVEFVKENIWKVELHVKDKDDISGIVYHLGHLYKVKKLFISVDSTDINVFDLLLNHVNIISSIV